MNTPGQKVFIFADDCALIEWYGAKGNIVHITVSDLRHTRQYAASHPDFKSQFTGQEIIDRLNEKDIDDEGR